MTFSQDFRRRAAAALTAGLVVVGLLTGQPASAGSPAGDHPAPRMGDCPPSASALSFSDALDKADVNGIRVGGLSSLAYDRRRGAWASAVDNHGTDPARIWFFRNLRDPHLLGAPLVLRRPDGSAYDGNTADDEGLAVLPDGRFLVSSETEPSVRIFGRDGVQQATLPVPKRFAVTGSTPVGEATANATLEGLSASRDGRTVVAAMEGALSGDVSAAGDATLHRFLVYTRVHHRWAVRQLAYRAETGQRVPEVAVLGHDLVVEEAAFDPAVGNTIQLYLVRGFDRAPDVSTVPDLSVASSDLVVGKKLLADLVKCPTLGATSRETQANPLLDNYEGMAVTTEPRRTGRKARSVGISLISDDNFSATQTTRVLNLRVRIPRGR